jgi:hypothetical protein
LGKGKEEVVSILEKIKDKYNETEEQIESEISYIKIKNKTI